MELGVPERDLARELMDVYRGLERWSDLYDVMTRRLSGLEGVERPKWLGTWRDLLGLN